MNRDKEFARKMFTDGMGMAYELSIRQFDKWFDINIMPFIASANKKEIALLLKAYRKTNDEYIHDWGHNIKLKELINRYGK